MAWKDNGNSCTIKGNNVAELLHGNSLRARLKRDKMIIIAALAAGRSDRRDESIYLFPGGACEGTDNEL